MDITQDRKNDPTYCYTRCRTQQLKIIMHNDRTIHTQTHTHTYIHLDFALKSEAREINTHIYILNNTT